MISAPSGGGKTTILRKVRESGNGDFRYSVSVTTRAKRPGEIDGKDYRFITLDTFDRMRENGEFVEWAEVHGYYYATPKTPITTWLAKGLVVLSDLDVYGGLSVKKHFGDAAVLIFVKPPSFESLVERLSGRNTESRAEIERRLRRYPDEMEKAKLYDYRCVNDDLEKTTREILEIINKHHRLH